MRKMCLLLSVFMLGGATSSLCTSVYAAQNWTQNVVPPRNKTTGFNAIQSMYASLKQQSSSQLSSEEVKKSTARSLIALITTGGLRDAASTTFFGVHPDGRQTKKDQGLEMIAAIKLTASIDPTLQEFIQYFIDHPMHGFSHDAHMKVVLKYFKQGLPPVNVGGSPVSRPNPFGGNAAGGMGDILGQLGQKKVLRNAADNAEIQFDDQNPMPFIDELKSQLPAEQQEITQIQRIEDDWEPSGYKDEEVIVQKGLSHLNILKSYFNYRISTGPMVGALRQDIAQDIGQDVFDMLEQIIYQTDKLDSNKKPVTHNGHAVKLWTIKKGAVAKYLADKKAREERANAKAQKNADDLQRKNDIVALYQEIHDKAKADKAEAERIRAEAERLRIEREQREAEERRRQRIAAERLAWDSQTLEKKIQDLKAISLDAGQNVIDGFVALSANETTLETNQYTESALGIKPLSSELIKRINTSVTKDPQISDYYKRILASAGLANATFTYYSINTNQMKMIVLKIQEASKEPLFIMVYNHELSGLGNQPLSQEVQKQFDLFVEGIKKAESGGRGKVKFGMFQ